MRSRRGFALLALTPPLAFAAVLALALASGRDATGPLDEVAWAQVSSCGNAILEPGEECDPPGSITCPAGSPAGAFQPCNAGCTCPAAEAPLDHFQCYQLKPSSSQHRTVTVQDQFGTLPETLRAPERLCPPADKNGEGIEDPTDHLVHYAGRVSGRFTKRTNQVVVNQFGTLILDVTRPDGLLVPTSKDGVAQRPPLDHFQCYKVRRSRGAPPFTSRTVTVADQLSTATTVTVRSPFRLCAPANKNGDADAPGPPALLQDAQPVLPRVAARLREPVRHGDRRARDLQKGAVRPVTQESGDDDHLGRHDDHHLHLGRHHDHHVLDHDHHVDDGHHLLDHDHQLHDHHERDLDDQHDPVRLAEPRVPRAERIPARLTVVRGPGPGARGSRAPHPRRGARRIVRASRLRPRAWRR